MSIRENLAIILFGISSIGLILGIILNRRYRNPYALLSATDQIKWRWAKNISYFQTIPIAGLIISYILSFIDISNNIILVFVFILIYGISFIFMVFWSKWNLERINKRNIKYSRKLKDSERLKLNQDYDFISPGDLAKFNKGGFPNDGIPILITQTLSQDQMEDQPRMIYEFFNHKGVDDLILTLGFGALSVEMYKPNNIELVNLVDIIEDYISQGKFRLGKDDLYIDDDNKEIKFTLCHESDVHFYSKDISILEEVESIWMGMKLQVRIAYDRND